MQAPPVSAKCVLQIKAKGARNLKIVQLIGKQDPYLKLWVGRGGMKVKTKVHVDGGKEAKWDQSFGFDLKGIDPSACLHYEVRNQNIVDTKAIGEGKKFISEFGERLTSDWFPIFCSKGVFAGEVLLEGVILTSPGDYASTHGSQHPGPQPQSHVHGSRPAGPQPHTHARGPQVSGTHTHNNAYTNTQTQARPVPPSPSTVGFVPKPQFKVSTAMPMAGPSSSAYGGVPSSSHSPSAGYQGDSRHYHQRPSTSGGQPFYGGGQPAGPSGFPRSPTAPPPAPSTMPRAHGVVGVGAAGHESGNTVYYRGGANAPPAAPSPSNGWDQVPASSPLMSTTWGAPAGGPSAPYASGTAATTHRRRMSAPSAPSAPPAPSAPTPAQAGYHAGGASYYNGGGGHASLPPGWEQMTAGDGRTYYLDHNTQTSHWTRPVAR